ncbi:VWA domain-containing protein [Paenibacillus lentus]|uniref:VWA domain-containing protein n=1 Tax=Paenibacillus lentus TaxID=1338368 RepID=A0A3S8S0K1_9BACL|nr:VWA domain-containing protein [Paenibacillus lentus]AZK48619.1 VWA domain-containing protein [Paenibacillus lentus]
MSQKKQNQSPHTFSLTRTFFLIFISLIFSTVSSSSTAFSDNYLQKEPADAFDAVFVLDTSYSMNHADPNKMANEVIHMFMDMSEASRTRVGFVAYNHQIVASKPLTSISVAANKTELKQKIRGLRRSGYTDLGLGLNTGGNLIASKTAEGEGSGRKPFIILLSDGETDFGPGSLSKRTAADSAKDVDKAISKAQKDGYPIYTIGLNHDGTVNPEELERIAKETGGASYMTSSADDLPEIFNRIFAAEMRSVLLPVAGVTATGQLQEVQVDIPNSSMREANIILLSEHSLKETQLFYSSENIRMFKSGSYTLIKVSQPKKGTAKLKFRGTSGDLVKINLLGSYEFEAKAAITSKAAIKGQPTGIEAYLIHPATSEQLMEQEVYHSLQGQLVVTDLKTNKETLVDMKNEGTRFYTQYTFPASGQYTWQVKMDGPSFYRHSVVHDQNIVNIAPAVHGSERIEILKEDGQSVLEMNDLFLDENGDDLTYTMQNGDHPNKLLNPELNSDKLILTPNQTGQAQLTVTATDSEGGSATAVLTINVKSKYTVLKWSIAGGVVLFGIAVGLFLWLRPKPGFAGKLEGYFLATASGSDVPVKSWPLTSFEGRKVNLLELFVSLDVHEPLPEAEQIVFTPGKGGKLIVKNTSRCSLVRNRTPLPKNKKEILEYNDKLYITFEDGITEIELRYKAIKPTTNIFTRSDSSGGQTG